MTRPSDATHVDNGGYLYKAGEELNWLRWNGDDWVSVGSLPTGTLTPLPNAVPPDPHGVYKVQRTMWQAADLSLHDSYQDAVNHGHFKDLDALFDEFVSPDRIDGEGFIRALLDHYKLERK